MPTTANSSTNSMIIHGGPILTMTRQGPAPAAVAVLDDRIAAVGTVDQCASALPLDKIDHIDLKGACLLPGFVDAHCHPLMHGQVHSWVDISPERAPDIPALIGLLREAAQGLPASVAVRGFGYEPGRLAERRHPDRRDLDQISRDREVYVMNVSGHGGVVNTFALEANGITADTPDPVGGRIGREAGGEPDGRVWDAACDMLTGIDGVKLGRHGPNFHLPDDDVTLDTQLDWAQDTFLASGVTSIGDAQLSRRELETYLRARDADRLKLRVSGYIISALLDQLLDVGLISTLGDDRFRVQGVKFYTDGAFGSRTVYLPDGYPGDCCHKGQLYHQPGDYAAMLARAHNAGLQTANHAQSSYAIGMVIDAVARANESLPRPGLRHRVEHCALPDDEQIKRMAELGIWSILQPQHNYFTGDWVLETIGSEAHRYSPCGLLEQSEAPYALSSDAPVAWPSPLQAIAAAVHRRTVKGTRLGGEDTAIDVMQALRAHTLSAATALHRENQVGSLEAGKYADFVVLDTDPTTVAPHEIDQIPVRSTWTGGTVAFTAQ